MAYPNNYFPVGYQPYQIPQPQPQPQPPQQQQAQFGFIRVPNEDVARSYPLAPNMSGTFIDENLPYIYTKTMGASQFEPPRFERYRLVKEDNQITEEKTQHTTSVKNDEYAAKSDLDKVQAEIKSLKNVIKSIQKELPQKAS